MLQVVLLFWWLLREGVTWFFHFEDRMAIKFDDWSMSDGLQILILIPLNIVIIALEIAVIRGIVSVPVLKRFFERIKVDKGIDHITRGKHVGVIGLASLALTPGMQKIGSIIYVTQPKDVGRRGYVALCVGGAARLILVILNGKKFVWGMIIGGLSLRVVMVVAENWHIYKARIGRVVRWIFQNGNHTSKIRRNKK